MLTNTSADLAAVAPSGLSSSSRPLVVTLAPGERGAAEGLIRVSADYQATVPPYQGGKGTLFLRYLNTQERDLGSREFSFIDRLSHAFCAEALDSLNLWKFIPKHRPSAQRLSRHGSMQSMPFSPPFHLVDDGDTPPLRSHLADPRKLWDPTQNKLTAAECRD